MTAPEAPPATSTALVAGHLGVHATDPEADELAAPVAAVNAWVAHHLADRRTAGGGWPEYIATGATMLAARIYRRRNSPAGVEAFNEMGPVYVQRNDPEVAQLLGLGRWAPPAVG